MRIREKERHEEGNEGTAKKEMTEKNEEPTIVPQTFFFPGTIFTLLPPEGETTQ